MSSKGPSSSLLTCLTLGDLLADDDRAALEEDTLFDVASITKVMATATAAMLCVERGLVGLDDPVASHLPEFTGAGREKATIRHQSPIRASRRSRRLRTLPT